MIESLAFVNARVVAANDIIDGGVLVEGDTIALVGDVDGETTIDLAGDYLMPGFVDVHTDNLERHIQPRPGVWWPPDSALAAHDAQVAAAGITTVLDAMAVGEYRTLGARPKILAQAVEAIERGAASDLLRAEHYLHLRLEVSDPKVVELFEPLAGNPLLRLASLMDHTPGQRQWHDLDKYKQFRMGRQQITADEVEDEIGVKIREQDLYADKHRRHLVDLLSRLEVRLASHDDTIPDHVAEAHRLGVSISEFPTTIEAAAAARQRGIATVLGAPNVARGGSHSGNVSAIDVAREGLLDALASDYVPSSLILAAFRIRDDIALSLPQTIAMISRTPARLAGFDDRGEIAPGLRADLVRVSIEDDQPAVRAVWRGGQRIA